MKISHFTWIFFLTTVVLFSSCSSKITGELYYDTNNNMIKDADESGAGYLRVKLYKDGSQISQGLTLPDGSFSLKYTPDKKSKICIRVDTSSAELFNVNPLSTKTTSASLSSKLTSTTTTDENDDTEDATDDESDSSDSDDDSDSSYVSDDDAVMTITSEGFCKELRRGGSFSIPVAIDFESAISELPTRLEKECYAGESCNVNIPYPEGCTLETMTLPVGLSYGTASSSSTSKSLSLKSKSSSGAIPEFTISTLDQSTVYLKVDEDIEEGKTKVTLEPTAKCLDESLALQTIPIVLIKPEKGAPDIRVYQNVQSYSNSIINLSITVQNKGDEDVEDGTLVALTGTEGSQTPWSAGGTTPSGCHSLLANGFECPGFKVVAGGSVSKVFKYEKSSSSTGYFTFPAKFKYKNDDGNEVVVNAESIGLYIEDTD